MPAATIGQTKGEILLLLLDGENTGEGLRQLIGMNLSVVRRHLDEMAANGLVETSLRREGVGRPRKYYRITTAGRETIAARYDLFADLLVQAIKVEKGPTDPDGLFESAAHLLAEREGQRRDADELLPALKELGFQPSLRKEDGKELIVSKNCPIIRLSQKYPELACDVFHTKFLCTVLGVPDVTLRQTIPRGAAECVHERPASASASKIR